MCLTIFLFLLKHPGVSSFFIFAWHPGVSISFFYRENFLAVISLRNTAFQRLMSYAERYENAFVVAGPMVVYG